LGPQKAALKPLPLLTSAAVTNLPEATALAVRKVHLRHMNALHPHGFSGWISSKSELIIGKFFLTYLPKSRNVPILILPSGFS